MRPPRIFVRGEASVAQLAAAAAAIIGVLQQRGRSTLASMLALEAVLLAVLAAIMLFRPQVTEVSNPRSIVAGLFGAMAMGTQSVVVRLLLHGVPQTNVMLAWVNREGDNPRQ